MSSPLYSVFIGFLALLAVLSFFIFFIFFIILIVRLAKNKTFKVPLIVIIICFTIFASYLIIPKPDSKVETAESTSTVTSNSTKSDSKKEETNPNDSKKDSQQSENNTSEENTFNHNSYYDVIREDIYSSSSYTYVIVEVEAKTDGKATATLIVYDSDENVVGKSEDTIVLCKGYVNYFSFHFDKNSGADTYTISANAKTKSFSESDRQKAVIEKYNIVDSYIYITFKQTADEIDYFDKFKILYFKDGQIVDSDDGYFSSYAKNLDEKGSTDVAKLWVSDKEFDSFIYIFEPSDLF